MGKTKPRKPGSKRLVRYYDDEFTLGDPSEYPELGFVDEGVPYLRYGEMHRFESDKGLWSDLEPDVVKKVKDAKSKTTQVHVVALNHGPIRERLRNLGISKVMWEETTPQARQVVRRAYEAVEDLEIAVQLLLEIAPFKGRPLHDAALGYLDEFGQFARQERKNPRGLAVVTRKDEFANRHVSGVLALLSDALDIAKKDGKAKGRRPFEDYPKWVGQQVRRMNDILADGTVERFPRACTPELFQSVELAEPKEVAAQILQAALPEFPLHDLARLKPFTRERMEAILATTEAKPHPPPKKNARCRSRTKR